MTQLAELDKCVKRMTWEVVDIRGVATRASLEAADVNTRLRAHTKTLEALRDTQLEQGRQISDLRSEMRAGFAGVNARFEKVEGEVREGFARVDERFTGMEKRFAQLEGEVKEGFATIGVGMARIDTLLRLVIDQPDQPRES